MSNTIWDSPGTAPPPARFRVVWLCISAQINSNGSLSLIESQLRVRRPGYAQSRPGLCIQRKCSTSEVLNDGRLVHRRRGADAKLVRHFAQISVHTSDREQHPCPRRTRARLFTLLPSPTCHCCCSHSVLAPRVVGMLRQLGR